MGQLHRQTDSMNRRGEAAEEELLFRLPKDFVQLWTHRALAWRIATAIYIGRVLQE